MSQLTWLALSNSIVFSNLINIAPFPHMFNGPATKELATLLRNFNFIIRLNIKEPLAITAIKVLTNRTGTEEQVVFNKR